MAVGLGAFTEGLQGGIAARDKMDLNRQYKSLLEQKSALGERELEGMEQARATEWMRNQGSMEGFEPMQFQKRKDPALMRFGGWLKGKLGGMFAQDVAQAEERGAGEQMAISSPEIQSGAANQQYFRDGGYVKGYYEGGGVQQYERDEDRRQAQEAIQSRARSTRAAGEDAGGLGAYLTEDVPRAAASYFDDTMNVATEGGKAVDEARQGISSARGARETGAAVTDYLGEQLRHKSATGIAVAKDAFVDNPISQFVAGAVGFDGGGDDETSPAIPGPATAAKTTPSTKADDTAAIKSNVDAPATSDEQMAQTAISEGEELAAENFDYRMLPENTRPEDMPSMSTTDWVDYRREMVDAMMLQGKNASEAHALVDDVTVDQQMRGMNRELQKAMNYLQMGDLRAAGFAIRQGFQYFPNGVDVKLAIQEGQGGQRALVAFGADEETGEPTGKPMLVTAETLGVMRENFSNPSAFRAWTKDGRQMQIDLADQSRKESDTRSNISYRQESAITDRMNAEANQIRALTGGSSGSGNRDSSIRAGNKAINEYLFNHGIDLEPEQMRLAEEIGGLMRSMNPDPRTVPDAQIGAIILQAADNGELQALYEEILRRQGG